MNSIELVSEAKLAASYRSLTKDSSWPELVIHQILVNARFRYTPALQPLRAIDRIGHDAEIYDRQLLGCVLNYPK